MVSSSSFDVLIIGSGPAGSFAAEAVARQGARVALFDGRPPGEPKACGGGVTSKALKLWPFLREATGREISEVEMYAPSGKGVRLKLSEPFVIFSRRTLDSYLQERARKAGAQVFRERVKVASFDREHGPWVVRAPNGAEWSGRMLVAADGANSPVARRLSGPLPPAEMEVAFGYRAPLPKFDEPVTAIAFLPGWAGYAWAFPRPDHISFGIATSQNAFDHNALDGLLWDFMVGYYRARADRSVSLWSAARERKDDAIKEKLLKAVERYAARIPGLSQEVLSSRRAAGDGWALLGDAAGFADPVTGEGIYYALRSAELFAKAYLEGRPLEYEERWRADFGRELCRAAQMRARFYGVFWGAPFTERMIELARAHPGIRRTLRELIAGDQGYMNLKHVLARRAVWPF
jgi:geranylgeranyl reductase family protein